MIKKIKNLINYINRENSLNNFVPSKFDNHSLIKLEYLIKEYLEKTNLEDIDYEILFDFLLLEIFPGIEDFESALYYIKIVMNKINFTSKVIEKEIWILFILNIYTENWIGISEETKYIFNNFLNHYKEIDKNVASMVFYQMATSLNDNIDAEQYYQKSISLNENSFNSLFNLASLYRERGDFKTAHCYIIKALSKILRITDNICPTDVTSIDLFLKYNVVGTYHNVESYQSIFNEYFANIVNK